MAMAFSGSIIKPWPFTGPIIIEEKAPDASQIERFIIDKWCLVGRIVLNEYGETEQESLQLFDLDTYKILARHILAGDGKGITTLTSPEINWAIT